MVAIAPTLIVVPLDSLCLRNMVSITHLFDYQLWCIMGANVRTLYMEYQMHYWVSLYSCFSWRTQSIKINVYS